MANSPTRDYLDRRLTEIKAACEARDGDLAVGILNLIRADGYPAAADVILNDLLDQGLRGMVSAGMR